MKTILTDVRSGLRKVEDFNVRIASSLNGSCSTLTTSRMRNWYINFELFYCLY